MVASSITRSNTSAQPALQAALDMVLEREWTTGNQLAHVGRTTPCTIRRWRRTGQGFDLDVVCRWLRGDLRRDVRTAFAFALTAGSDLHFTCSHTDAGDGADALKTLILAHVHFAQLLAGVDRADDDGRITHNEVAAVQPDAAAVVGLVTRALGALAVQCGVPVVR